MLTFRQKCDIYLRGSADDEKRRDWDSIITQVEETVAQAWMLTESFRGGDDPDQTLTQVLQTGSCVYFLIFATDEQKEEIRAKLTEAIG